MKFGRTTTTAIAAFAAVLVAASLSVYAGGESHIAASTSSMSASGTITVTESATTFSVESLGPIVPLSAASQDIGANVVTPAALPDNLTLSQVRGTNSLVVLVYQSPTLPTLQNWDVGSMIVWIARDNTSYVPVPSSQIVGGAEMTCSTNMQVFNAQDCTTISATRNTVTQTTIENIEVSGNPGHGSNPQGADGIGQVTWWANGLHYTIDADLPVSTLISVAQSMES